MVIVISAIVVRYYYSRYQCTHYKCEERADSNWYILDCDFKSVIKWKYECTYIMPMLPDVNIKRIFD